MQKLILVYAVDMAELETRVLAPARQLRGWMVGKYLVRLGDFDTQVQNLVRLLEDGDLVVAAGNDRVVSAAVNAIMQSGKQAALGILRPDGGKIAALLGQEELSGIVEKFAARKTRLLAPLVVKTNNDTWRYALSEVRVGMLASFAAQRNGSELTFWELLKWYIKGGRKLRLPAGGCNGEPWPKRATDYLAINGITAMREWYLEEYNYLSVWPRISNSWRLWQFVRQYQRKELAGEACEKEVLAFLEPSTVALCADGVAEEKVGIKEISVRKSRAKLRIVTNK